MLQQLTEETRAMGNQDKIITSLPAPALLPSRTTTKHLSSTSLFCQDFPFCTSFLPRHQRITAHTETTWPAWTVPSTSHTFAALRDLPANTALLWVFICLFLTLPTNTHRLLLVTQQTKASGDLAFANRINKKSKKKSQKKLILCIIDAYSDLKIDFVLISCKFLCFHLLSS